MPLGPLSLSPRAHTLSLSRSDELEDLVLFIINMEGSRSSRDVMDE